MPESPSNAIGELRAILFDVDGTLSETEEIHRRAFNDTFRVFGLGWHWDKSLYRRLLEITGGKERLAHYIRYHRRGLWRTGKSEELVRRAHELKTSRYTELVARGAAVLRPGVERLLREAKQTGIRLGIATTTSLPNVEALLCATLGPDASSWFDVICAGDCVPQKKPAADVYLRALDALGLAPAQCLAIEDSEHGLSAARSAGIATVVTPSEYTKDQDFDGAALVLDHLGDPNRACCVLHGNPGYGPIIDVGVLATLIQGDPLQSGRPQRAAR